MVGLATAVDHGNGIRAPGPIADRQVPANGLVLIQDDVRRIQHEAAFVHRGGAGVVIPASVERDRAGAILDKITGVRGSADPGGDQRVARPIDGERLVADRDDIGIVGGTDTEVDGSAR
jgi:hypothetical protein